MTKATASVRIAHESVLAATLAVAREKMQGVSTGPPSYPNPDHDEELTWEELVAQGLVTRKKVLNRDVEASFAGTLWEGDDPESLDDPDGVYLDLWIVDLGPKSIAKAVLSEDGYAELRSFLEISTSDEPLLVIDAGRHGLVSSKFVRNTSPDWLSAEQDGLPVALRDADLLVELHDDLPAALQDGAALILRTDRRLGFDPTREWIMNVKAVRKHGVFQPEVGSVTVTATHVTPERFYLRAGAVEAVPPWLEALRNRQADVVALGLALAALFLLLITQMNRLAGHPLFTPIRLGILAVVVGFIGWWGQGQLSIVTVLGVIRTAWDGGSFSFLLYDPFSLLVWAAAIIGFVLWGRGYFCGWLCPFGALQEFAHALGQFLRLPKVEPSGIWDRRLKWIKYVLLAGLVATVFIAPQHVDTVAEVEPFKTAITVFFIREWGYVLYAAFWIVLSLFLFKGFCRYVCPLGAVMAIGGLVRGRDWIERREACGSPCQLCKVRCKYGSIDPAGKVDYSECFQCLDCVTIYDDPNQCVPLVLQGRGRAYGMAAK